MSLYLSLLVGVLSLAQAFQFCAKERETKTDICANIRMFANDTTQETDVLVTLSARLEERRGWAAIAPGHRMSGALMFVVYPGDGTQGACRSWRELAIASTVAYHVCADHRTDVTLSVRTTQGHVAPEPAEKAPAITVSHTGVDGNGYHVASLICHSCAAWGGNEVEIKSPAMPWLWASDYFGTAQTADVGWPITKHEAYG